MKPNEFSRLGHSRNGFDPESEVVPLSPSADPGMRAIYTLIPGQAAIELVAYYPEFLDYYPNCELQALRLVRPGGIVIWRDFCPDPRTLSQAAAPRGVMRAVLDHFKDWRPSLSRLFWVRPSWILIGVRA